MESDYRRTSYVYGSAATRRSPRREEYRTPQRVRTVRNKRNAKRQTMNLGFVVFLAMALSVTAFACISYVRLQSSLTSYVSHISSLEANLESLKAENDDYESRIKGSVSLEDVKKRAMDDLGMTYARQDQIVVYESEGTDYVRQYVAIE